MDAKGKATAEYHKIAGAPAREETARGFLALAGTAKLPPEEQEMARRAKGRL